MFEFLIVLAPYSPQRRLCVVRACGRLRAASATARVGRCLASGRDEGARARQRPRAISIRSPDRHHADRHHQRRLLRRGFRLACGGLPPKHRHTSVFRWPPRLRLCHRGHHVSLRDHRRTGPQEPRAAQCGAHCLPGRSLHVRGGGCCKTRRLVAGRIDAARFPAAWANDGKRTSRHRRGDQVAHPRSRNVRRSRERRARADLRRDAARRPRRRRPDDASNRRRLDRHFGTRSRHQTAPHHDAAFALAGRRRLVGRAHRRRADARVAGRDSARSGPRCARPYPQGADRAGNDGRARRARRACAMPKCRWH